MPGEVARGDRVHLRRLGPEDRDAFLEAVARSRRLHEPWSSPPATPEDYDAYTRRREQRTLAVVRSDTEALAGVYTLSRIFYGRFHNAYLGYYAFVPHAGKGFMHDGLELVLAYAFGDLRLHRVEANVRPGNVRSVALLRRSGFRLEGSSPRYLFLDEAWRDHLSFARLAEDAPPVLGAHGPIEVREVTSLNWRAVAGVRARREQLKWVAHISRYLALCAYGGDWRPLAISAGDEVVGFVMWARDPDDLSYWIGGFVIDRRHQGLGYGRAALDAMVTYLRTMPGCRQVALSYRPDNTVARGLYASAGFVETGEMEDDEVVARLQVRPLRRRT